MARRGRLRDAAEIRRRASPEEAAWQAHEGAPADRCGAIDPCSRAKGATRRPAELVGPGFSGRGGSSAARFDHLPAVSRRVAEARVDVAVAARRAPA